jgi:hypothetical protein
MVWIYVPAGTVDHFISARNEDCINLSKYAAFIVLIRRNHWVTIARVDDVWYKLDSFSTRTSSLTNVEANYSRSIGVKNILKWRDNLLDWR